MSAENWVKFAYWPNGSFAVFESEYEGRRSAWVHRIRKDYTVRAEVSSYVSPNDTVAFR